MEIERWKAGAALFGGGIACIIAYMLLRLSDESTISELLGWGLLFTVFGFVALVSELFKRVRGTED